MCHCIFFGINPRVSKHHAFHLYCTTWWQLGLNSKEDICVTLCQSLVEASRAGLSQTPSIAIGATSPSCGNKCAHQRRSSSDQQEVQQRVVVTVTQGVIQVVLFHLRVTYRSCPWLLRAVTLVHGVG